MAKITVVDCATKDGVVIVVGTKKQVRSAILGDNSEWITLTVLGASMKPQEVDILNVPRQILMIGAEREIDLDPTPNAPETGHVSLA